MNRITVDEWFEIWIETYKRRTVKQGTLEAYRSTYMVHFSRQIGHIALTDLTPASIQILLNRLSDSGYANETISVIFIILNCMLKCAKMNELITENPCDKVIVPHGRKKTESVAFTLPEQAQFIKYANMSPLKNYFLLGLYTGMRGGELSALRWSDVNMEKNTVSVNHTLKFSTGRGYWLDTPKTESSVREIPLIPQARSIIEKSFASYNYTQNDYVCSTGPSPITKNKVSASLNEMRNEMQKDGTQFPYFTMHSTRHTFATRCIESGMKPSVLQKIMGHSSISTTMDIYVKVQESEKVREMLAVADAFL